MTAFKSNPDKRELRNFGLLTGGMTGGIFGIVLPLLFDHDFPKWPWVVAIILLIWALTAPATLKPIYHAWMTIGQALGWVNTRIIMSIMFYLLILPVGLFKKLSGRDPMERTLSKKKKSYRISSSIPDKKHMDKPF